MTRRQLLALAAAAPATAAVSAPAAPGRHFEVGEPLALAFPFLGLLYEEMDALGRARAVRHQVTVGLLSEEMARHALDLDLPPL